MSRIYEQITIRKCHTMVATKRKLNVSLNGVNYVLEFWVILFCINKLLKYGFKLRNEGLSVFLLMGAILLSFDCNMSAL
jgi:hypothetical protein